MENETTTNPVEGEDVRVAPEAEVETETVADEETELDEFGNPAEPEPEEYEEIERNGTRYRIPRALTPELMMQADYTRKTQELAEQRRAIEAERESVQQARQEELAAQARIVAIDDQIARFREIDWDQWENDSPFEAQKGWRHFQQIQQERGHAAAWLGHMAQQRTLQAQHMAATRLKEAAATLARDIPDWSPELGAKLLDFGVKQYGFTRAELESFEDARMVKVLHAAFAGDAARNKQQRAQNHVAAQSVKPAARISGASPRPRLDDRTDTAAWIEQRNRQQRKRA